MILGLPKGSDELPGGPAGHLGDAADPCRLEDESCGGPEEGLCFFLFVQSCDPNLCFPQNVLNLYRFSGTKIHG